MVAWSTGTAGIGGVAGPAKLTFGCDGDLLLSSADGSTLWSSGTGGPDARRGPAAANTAGLYLAVDDGGVARLVDASGASVWHTGGSVWAQARGAAGGLLDVTRQGVVSAGRAAGRAAGWVWGLVPGGGRGGSGGGAAAATEGSEAGGGA